MNGYIYVMSNPMFRDNIIKIGKTRNNPDERKKDLYSTGVPEPFKVEYYALVKDFDSMEKVIHEVLRNKRPNKNREFFTISVSDAIIAIRGITRVIKEKVLYRSPEEIIKAQQEFDKKIRMQEKKQEEELKINEERLKAQRAEEVNRKIKLEHENQLIKAQKEDRIFLIFFVIILTFIVINIL